MYTQESLSLANRFELPQTTLPDTLQHINRIGYDGFAGYIWSLYPGGIAPFQQQFFI
jgi:hypothetical protein